MKHSRAQLKPGECLQLPTERCRLGTGDAAQGADTGGTDTKQPPSLPPGALTGTGFPEVLAEKRPSQPYLEALARADPRTLPDMPMKASGPNSSSPATLQL